MSISSSFNGTHHIGFNHGDSIIEYNAITKNKTLTYKPTQTNTTFKRMQYGPGVK